MAIDQAILETAAETGQTTLRIYRWQPATLSLGYFQKAAARESHHPSSTCPIIRRASGGGAIVHDDELTYSLCIASEGSIATANAQLYDIVHLAIRESLAKQGISVSLYEAPPNTKARAKKSDPFLCFERRAVGDLICDGSKVGGSAQRRLKNALIQHGSLLLSQSEFAPELPGLKELSGLEVDTQKLNSSIALLLATALQIQFTLGSVSESERQRANKIAEQKFLSEAWLNKR